jgi:hypothetical protein
MRPLDSDRTQAAIATGRTDFQEQGFGVVGKLDLLTTLQYSDRFGQKWIQTFGANLSINLPDLFQRSHNFTAIDGSIPFGLPQGGLNLYWFLSTPDAAGDSQAWQTHPRSSVFQPWLAFWYSALSVTALAVQPSRRLQQALRLSASNIFPDNDPS